MRLEGGPPYPISLFFRPVESSESSVPGLANDERLDEVGFSEFLIVLRGLFVQYNYQPLTRRPCSN
jgi:hypothetical protein